MQGMVNSVKRKRFTLTKEQILIFMYQFRFSQKKLFQINALIFLLHNS